MVRQVRGLAQPASWSPSGRRDRTPQGGRLLPTARTAIGGFFLSMAGVHVGLVAADPEFYAPFADQALSGWVRDRWVDVFMANPATWGLAVAAGELALGILLLVGGRWARSGYVGVIGFHLTLMLFGWGFWAWSLPALALLIPLARSEFRHGELAAQAATPTRFAASGRSGRALPPAARHW